MIPGISIYSIIYVHTYVRISIRQQSAKLIGHVPPGDIIHFILAFMISSLDHL